MKVHLVKELTIIDYAEKNASGSASFTKWIILLKKARWDIPEDIVKTFNSADLLGNGSERAVFNIGGNKYRMICKYFFGKLKVHLYVCWIGTHAEYDKICNMNEQYTVNRF